VVLRGGLTRAGLGALERLSPPLGARWARHLWLTPPPLARRPGRPLPGGPPPGEQFQVYVDDVGTVAAEAWGTGPVVYLVHGWGGTRASLHGMVGPLVSAGFRVISFDGPGHGDSGSGGLGGRRSTLSEFAAAIRAVTDAGGPAYAIVGHSGGGNAAALAVGDGVRPTRLVFLAPVADPIPYAHAFIRMLGAGPRIQRHFDVLLTAAVGRDLADFSVPRIVSAADRPLPPVLVVHDRDDREIALTDGQLIAETWPDARLVVTAGLGHRRLLADPEVIRTVVAYVTDAAA
jgi:pimeloyl-ACP methyl ester carboxylesterase